MAETTAGAAAAIGVGAFLTLRAAREVRVQRGMTKSAISRPIKLEGIFYVYRTGVYIQVSRVQNWGVMSSLEVVFGVLETL